MTSEDKPRRRSPRFARVAGRRMRLTERDLAMLRAVFRYRFLRSSHLTKLIGGSEQQLLRRLRLLYDTGLLDRIDSGATGQREIKNETIVYGLTSGGASALADADASPGGRSDWTTKNKRASLIFRDHTLMISDVMAPFELACRVEEKVALIDEVQAIAMMPEKTRLAKHPLHWRAVVDLPGLRPTPVGLFPDRVFSLAFDDNTRTNFILEADRGTMRVQPRSPKKLLERNSYTRKLLAYQVGWKAGYHTTRFGWQNFRVLTVTSSPERVESMLKALGDVTDGRGAGMFLFADIETLIQANPLTYPWIDGKGKEVRLLD